jgi:hypothetical protein
MRSRTLSSAALTQFPETYWLYQRREYMKERAAKADDGQLVIHKQNGRIQTEHTYGNDPRRRKG